MQTPELSDPGIREEQASPCKAPPLLNITPRSVMDPSPLFSQLLHPGSLMLLEAHLLLFPSSYSASNKLLEGRGGPCVGWHSPEKLRPWAAKLGSENGEVLIGRWRWFWVRGSGQPGFNLAHSHCSPHSALGHVLTLYASCLPTHMPAGTFFSSSAAEDRICFAPHSAVLEAPPEYQLLYILLTHQST